MTSSPFAPSFCNDTLHPSIDGRLQHCVPTLSLLSNEGDVKVNGKFSHLGHLKFLFRGGDGCSVGRGI